MLNLLPYVNRTSNVLKISEIFVNLPSEYEFLYTSNKLVRPKNVQFSQVPPYMGLPFDYIEDAICMCFAILLINML